MKSLNLTTHHEHHLRHQNHHHLQDASNGQHLDEHMSTLDAPWTGPRAVMMSHLNNLNISSSLSPSQPFSQSTTVGTVMENMESVLRLLNIKSWDDEGDRLNGSVSAVQDFLTTVLSGNTTMMSNGTAMTQFSTAEVTAGRNISAQAHISSMTMESFKKLIYSIIVPLMLLFCALSSIINLLIVFSVRWCRKPMTPTLYFSISLALADAFASTVIGLGLIVNSFLPTVYNVSIGNQCFTLTLEAFRLGGVVVAVTHLMALAINHWIGIVRPLQYEATMTRGTALRVIIVSWIAPIFILLLYFSSVQGQGFQSTDCKNYNFMKQQTFRLIFASFFFAPLAVMTFIYWHIFVIVRSHIHYRRKYQSCMQLRRNVKAVVTTVLILGTYIVGWMPAILWYILVCDDCMYLLSAVPAEIKIPINIVINILVIMKAVVDPIIYAARMTDIQIALRKMRYDFFLWIFESCAPPRSPPLDTLEMGYTGNTAATSHSAAPVPTREKTTSGFCCMCMTTDHQRGGWQRQQPWIPPPLFTN